MVADIIEDHWCNNCGFSNSHANKNMMVTFTTTKELLRTTVGMHTEGFPELTHRTEVHFLRTPA